LSYISTVINWEIITEKPTELAQIISVADFFRPSFFVPSDRRWGNDDLSVFNSTVASNRKGLIIATFLNLVAILGKVITRFTVFGNFELNKLAIDVAMIPREEVGLVFKKKGSMAESVDKVQK
jgi:hypothetical protein